MVETKQGSGGKGGRHRGQGKGVCVEWFVRTPSCSVESDVRASSRIGEGGGGGVSIKDVGRRCCWHGEWGGWLGGKEGSEGLGSGRAMVFRQAHWCIGGGDVRAGSWSDEGGVGGVSIRDVGDRCCRHGEQGVWLDGKDESGGLGSDRVMAL